MSKSTPAPDFTLESLDGNNLRLSDFRGKAVLLNFWATWCAPCKIEMPWFVDFQKEYGEQGLQIVGVAMDDSSKEDIAKFAMRDVFETFASVGQALVHLDRRLLHDGMAFLGSAEEQEVVAPGDPLMAVFGVECQAKQCRFLDDLFVAFQAESRL